MSYTLAKMKREKAYERYNYATVALEKAQIEERAEQVREQHQPSASIIKLEGYSEREKLDIVVHYVLTGALPEGAVER